MAEHYKKQPSCTLPDGTEWFASGGGNTNPEHIEREAVLAAINEVVEDYAGEHSFSTDFAVAVVCELRDNVVATIPATDVVPVVRCKDCKHFRRNLENDTYCGCVGGLTDPEEHDFCSYGERRQADETK